VLVRPDQVVAVTKSILDLFRARGPREKRNAARFRFLLDEIGVSGVLQWLEKRSPSACSRAFHNLSPRASMTI